MNDLQEKEGIITFVAKKSTSGKKVLLNIPVDKRDEVKDDTYYKVYLVPINFEDFHV